MALTKIEYLMQEMNSAESFGQLAAAFGTKIVNDQIHIPAEHGSGLIRKIKLEEGLYLRSWEMSLNKPMLFRIIPAGTPYKLFHITYMLNPETVVLTQRSIEKQFRAQKGMNILFTSNDINFEVEIAPIAGNYTVDISFDARWLRESFGDAGVDMKNFIERLLDSESPTIFFESTSLTEYRTLAQLHQLSLSSTIDPLPVRACALSLLAGFFSKMQVEKPNEVLEADFFYYQKILEVEKILLEHLKLKLPAIDEIARRINLSESTLKRHFKLMFGKSIYEYYLELKMDLAKRMLLEKPLSVSEVAALLNYERVSSFIDMFKKIHGVSPGALRRKPG